MQRGVFRGRRSARRSSEYGLATASDYSATARLVWLARQAYDGASTWDPERRVSVATIPGGLSEDELELLARAGRLPNAFVSLNHDETLVELRQLADSWDGKQAADAFVASLWSAPFVWRAVLPAKVIMSVMPDHVPEGYASGSSTICGVCGFDWSTLDTTDEWISRMVYGVPLDGVPSGYLLTLREVAAMECPVPTGYDRWVLRAWLTVLRGLPAKTRYAKAVQAAKRTGLLPTANQHAYANVLEALALMGALDTPERPGMATRFSSYRERDQRPNVRVEVQAPLAWWDSSAGINEATLAKLFDGFDTSPVDLDNPPEPQPALKETVTGALARLRRPGTAGPKALPEAGKGPAQPGDVYALRVREGCWITAFVHEVAQTDTVRARMEYLQGVFEQTPIADQLIPAFQPRIRGAESTRGRDQRWVASLDSTRWVRRITRGFPTPPSGDPEPSRVSAAGAKDLIGTAYLSFEQL